MFVQLRRKFYSVLIVILALVAVLMGSAYVVIENALVNDYTSKTADLARKVANDFRIKSDYAEDIALLFVGQLVEKTDQNGEIKNEEFQGNLNTIRIYDSDIDGLGIFWDNGRYMLSASAYFKYAQELRELSGNVGEKKWFVVSDGQNSGYIFLILPIVNSKSQERGFAAVDVTPLKRIYDSENMFFQDAVAYLETDGNRLYLGGAGSRYQEDSSVMTQSEQLQDGFQIVMKLPMSEVEDRLRHVKLFLILFGVLCVGFAYVTVRHMVRRITFELETLKREIDTYAKNGSGKGVRYDDDSNGSG